MRNDVLLTRQDWEYDIDFEEIYVPVRLYELECFLLAVKHCNRPSHKTAMTDADGHTYSHSTMYEIEEQLKDLIKAARRRLRERTDDGAGQVS
jgi:hypothetical protein